jgi:hypothetical protein
MPAYDDIQDNRRRSFLICSTSTRACQAGWKHGWGSDHLEMHDTSGLLTANHSVREDFVAKSVV